MVVCNKERIKEFDSEFTVTSEIEGGDCEQILTDADMIDFRTKMDDRSFYELTDQNECEDLIYTKNEETLWQTIVGEIKTPKGALSNSIGQSTYGCEIWEYKGAILNSLDISEIEYYIIQTCIKYSEVNNIINIETWIGDDTALFIEVTVDSIYGTFDGHLRIPNAHRTDRDWMIADSKFFNSR